MTPSVAIGIDLGGTNLKAAAVDRQGKVLAAKATPIGSRDPDELIDEMVRFTDRLLAELSLARCDMVGVGVGSPGPLSLKTGRVIRAANLPGWVDVPLRDRLRDKLQVPVVLENDGNAAAFGEFWGGAGKGSGDLVMLTLGTGVGAGVILDGKILHGHFENAAELGHMIVAVDGPACSCGQRGCLEQFASAAAVTRRVSEAIKVGETSAAGQEGDDIDAERVVSCARKGDALCARVFDDACRYLAVACINIQHTFNPAQIILGGGLSNAGTFLLDRVAGYVQSLRWQLIDDLPAISLAKLGYDAGVIGAAGLAWNEQEHI